MTIQQALQISKWVICKPSFLSGVALLLLVATASGQLSGHNGALVTVAFLFAGGIVRMSCSFYRMWVSTFNGPNKPELSMTE